MNIVIQSSIETLKKSKSLLHVLNDEQLSDCSVPPYNSSIGCHVRHIMDFYDCILTKRNHVDLTHRKRQIDVETNCDVALKYSNKLMQWRVLLQFVAIIVLVGFAYFFKN